MIYFTGSPKKMQFFCPKCSLIYECRDIELKKRCQPCRTLCYYQCLECNAQYRRQAGTRKHYFSNKDCSSKAFLCCNDCNYKTLSKHNLKIHMQAYHMAHMNVRPAAKSLAKCSKCSKCSKCGKVFKNSLTLKKHQNYHCGKRQNFSCEFCMTYKTYQLAYVRDHIVKVHMKQARKEAG